MSHPGIMVMLRAVFGEDVDVSRYAGRIIRKCELDTVRNRVRMTFDDGSGIAIFDDGQSCCEERYLHTDDDLSVHVGHALQDLRLKEGPTTTEGNWTVKETSFLEILSDAGSTIVVAYNEHNGFYGGFALTIAEESDDA